MQNRHPEFSYPAQPRRDGTPRTGVLLAEKQAALPALMFERLSFLSDLDVIEHFNFDAWFAAIAETNRLMPLEIK